ncbi:MAG: SAM-dependent methyltransferase [Rickettsiales bacterium]|jgi:hypothetical protein|nr:SAM-dependent methyltransferase [Rickettsiales bacterium]
MVVTIKIDEKMKRIDIINYIGRKFLTSNIENDEFSYVKELNINPSGNYKLDIRFEIPNKHLSILVETKQNFKDSDKEQLFNYARLEKQYKPQNNIIAILSNTNDDKTRVWKISSIDGCEEYDDKEIKDASIKSAEEYLKYFEMQNINDKQKVMQATYKLNEILHKNGITESLRSQFVGSCLLALNDDVFEYKNGNLTTKQIIEGIKGVIEKLLGSSQQKDKKLKVLSRNILNNEKIENLQNNKFKVILDYIKENIIPFINQTSNKGQDLLNLFFTTFNKYVGKEDKNQAFTPDHIVHFMCKVAEINRDSVVLDPTCGSGAFLVQAMMQAIADCGDNNAAKEKVKKEQIFGIENEERAFGLSTTNMLIHGDGNSNIIYKDGFGCFGMTKDTLKSDFKTSEVKINRILMNPPYNAVPNNIPNDYKKDWKKEKDEENGAEKEVKSKTDPTKGFVFVNHCINFVEKEGKLLCLLPLSAAIGSSDIIKKEKAKILKNNMLEAVFTLPSEVFFPGASVGVCCMVFRVGAPHMTQNENGELIPRFPTFFGYFKEDGLVKKKNLGRVDIKDRWENIEKEWLDLYRGTTGNRVKSGLSVLQKVDENDEWLAEAYMETSYDNLKQDDFECAVQDYLSFLVKNK